MAFLGWKPHISKMLLKFILLCIAINFCIADMEITPAGFKVWRQKQKTTQKNHIKLRFKTTHATGLIMYATGANKKDFLSIELYRGKIRVAGNYGRGTENRLRPIGGFYDMYLGKDLADNEWHTVEFIRNVRESIIFIDRNRGKMEKSSFMKSPPTYNELSVSMVTFGGYYSYALSELSSNKALSRKGFGACFSEATFSQEWPEDNNQEINFLANNNNFQVLPTATEVTPNFCPAPAIPYKPLFFPSSAVHIALIQNYTIQSLKVGLMFRTVVNDQMLANYTSKGSGERIQFRIDRKGRVSLGIDIDLNMQVIETAKENYHDGEWHTASFEIDNKEVTEGETTGYVGKFTVDGKTRLSALSKSFYFNGFVNVGFGFTGCMREIKINDQDIERVNVDPREPEKFFDIVDTGVMHNFCSLKDYCNPNPCQNGGKCNQTEDNIVCDCRDTLYEGSTCHRARFNYTCAGVRKSGERRSDVYFIDFDGMGPMEPVRALCDLGKTVESTVTQINNTKHIDFSVATPTGKNDVDINYAASIIQMRELIMNSAHCEQFIKYRCKGTPIFKSPEGPPAVRWMGGDDILHYYWGGARNNRGYCECGLNRDCRNIQKYCNCDDLDAFSDVFDEGNFTVKEHLPVRQVQFFEVLESSSIMAVLRVGHLRCQGFGSRLISATFRKPWSFLSVDHADQPFDNIFAGELSFDFKTSVAYNYMIMAHAHGPFSGDYAKVMIWSKTMVRVHLNFGFGDIKQDVDISSTGRTLDDNQWHEFNMMFNMKELNVTLDGIRMIQGLPLQDDPVQFNVDDKSVYIGGSYHDKNGFIGCIRSLYVNGRIHNIYEIAQGQEDYGVYPGCGAACTVLNRPCNYGFCIDEYDAFKCNCSVSPYDGKFCQNETYPKKFTGSNNIVYDLSKANMSEPVADAIFTIGFKTNVANQGIAQLEGNNGRHFTLTLIGGYLTLFYTYKEKTQLPGVVLIDKETEVLQILDRRLDNDEHNIARVHFSTQEIYLTVPNYELSVGANVTERFIDERNKNLGMKQDYFEVPTKFSVGQIVDLNIDTKGPPLPLGFTGCMSGAKLVLQPRATASKRFRKSVEYDMFKMISQEGVKIGENPTGSFPALTDVCGKILPTPGTLPSVGPPRQFFTRSPGLDNSVNLTTVDTANHIIIFLVIIIIAVVLLGFLYLIYKYVNRSHIEYRRVKKTEKPSIYRAPVSSQQKSYQPMASSSNVPPPTYNQVNSGGGGGGGDDQDFFL